MRAMILAGVLSGFVVPFGAPAGFDVRGAEVQARRAGDSADVRIVYDLSVRDAACGWFLAEFDDLPGGASAPKAALVFDGKEVPAVVEEGGGKRRVQAFQQTKDEGRLALERSKSIQLVLTFPAAPCTGPEMSVSIPVPRPHEYGDDAKKEPKREFPRLAVRFDAEGDGVTAEVRATFRAVPFGSRLVLRADAASAGASLAR